MLDKLNTNKLITPAELAEILSLSKQSVYRLTENGELPFYKIGGSLRFKAKDINNYLNGVRVDLTNNNDL
jgi:excisionase family DNA binding protein